jgi:hypothetical protein
MALGFSDSTEEPSTGRGGGASALNRLLLILVLLPGGALTGEGETGRTGSGPAGKLGFDPDLINEDGLYGPPDGLRALDYEFCIPDVAAYRHQVAAIDPSIRFSGSPGRIGCSKDEVLALGNSHQPHFRSILERLAVLPFVMRIEPAWFE